MSDILRQKIYKLVEELVSIEEVEKKSFEIGKSYIPVSGKVTDANEIKNMVAASLDGWLTTGHFNKEFEENLKSFIGVKHLLTVNSGSSANLVAFTTLTSHMLGERAIQPGDEVISVAASFPTTVNPILQNNCIPVFVDVNMKTYNIDISKIENAITKKTKAIFIAHTLGNPFDLDAVMDICKRNNLWLVEDCCDALGSKYADKHVGTYGDIATLSFYPAHHITMGEGGAVFTNSAKLNKIAHSIRDWGRDCWCEPGEDNTCGKRFSWEMGELPKGYDHKYIYSHMGYNLKITDMQAACGLAQLNKLNSFIKVRKANFSYLKKGLEKFSNLIYLPEATLNSDPSWFGFPITLRDNLSFTRLVLSRYLEENKIGTRLLFAGNLTKQPYMKGRNFKVSGNLDNTDKIMRDTFWIGVYPGITTSMLDYIIEKLAIFFDEYA